MTLTCFPASEVHNLWSSLASQALRGVGARSSHWAGFRARLVSAKETWAGGREYAMLREASGWPTTGLVECGGVPSQIYVLPLTPYCLVPVSLGLLYYHKNFWNA